MSPKNIKNKKSLAHLFLRTHYLPTDHDNEFISLVKKGHINSLEDKKKFSE